MFQTASEVDRPGFQTVMRITNITLQFVCFTFCLIYFLLLHNYIPNGETGIEIIICWSLAGRFLLLAPPKHSFEQKIYYCIGLAFIMVHSLLSFETEPKNLSCSVTLEPENSQL